MYRLPRLQTFDSWTAYPDYRLLWIGNFFSNNAQWLQLLTVGWLVRELTSESSSSALLVVTVGGMSRLPGLIAGPWGGVLGDRLDRRKLIMYIQSFMAVFALLFAFLVLSERIQVWHAFAYVLISGVCMSVTMPMRQALIANTVPRESLGNAYAVNVLTIPGTRMIGPFIGGILVATLGFFWNFTIEAFLYAGTVLSLLPMKTPYYMRRKSAKRKSVVSDLREGINYVRKDNRIILTLILLSLIPNVILQPVLFMLPIFTEEVLKRGADVGGYLLSTNGFGGLMAALLIASFGFVFRRGQIVLATAVFSSIFAILLAQTDWLIGSFILIGLFASSQTAFRTTVGALVQTLVTDNFRGRATSLQQYGQGFVVVTSLLIGWFAGATSVSLALSVVGATGLVASLVFIVTTRKLRQLA